MVFPEGTDKAAPGADKKEDDFDADVAIATGELGQLLPALLEALGGEQESGAPALADAGAAAAAPATAAPASSAPQSVEEEEAPF
mgnify:CR=1 FL=1